MEQLSFSDIDLSKIHLGSPITKTAKGQNDEQSTTYLDIPISYGKNEYLDVETPEVFTKMGIVSRDHRPQEKRMMISFDVSNPEVRKFTDFVLSLNEPCAQGLIRIKDQLQGKIPTPILNNLERLTKFISNPIHIPLDSKTGKTLEVKTWSSWVDIPNNCLFRTPVDEIPFLPFEKLMNRKFSMISVLRIGPLRISPSSSPQLKMRVISSILTNIENPIPFQNATMNKLRNNEKKVSSLKTGLTHLLKNDQPKPKPKSKPKKAKVENVKVEQEEIQYVRALPVLPVISIPKTNLLPSL